MCSTEEASALIKVLRDDIGGELLAEYVSDIHKNDLKISLKGKKNTVINFLPAVSPIDLSLMCFVKINNGLKSQQFKSIVLSEFPDYKYAFEYSLMRIKEIGLLRIIDDKIFLSDLGEKVLRTAITSINIVKEKVKSDSVLNLYSSL